MLYASTSDCGPMKVTCNGQQPMYAVTLLNFSILISGTHEVSTRFLDQERTHRGYAGGCLSPRDKSKGWEMQLNWCSPPYFIDWKCLPMLISDEFKRICPLAPVISQPQPLSYRERINIVCSYSHRQDKDYAFFFFFCKEEAKGTIAFTTSGRPDYGFGIFSVKLPSTLSGNLTEELTERPLTDGTSNNFNGQFVEENEGTITYISERTGSTQIFLTRTEIPEPEQLQTIPESLFHDRPVIKNGRLIYVSAHEKPDVSFKSWSAVYETQLDVQTTVRLTPRGVVDYSPSISKSGKFIAVASYEYRSWNRDMNVLETDIVVFPLADPTQRKIVCKNGGWPTWSGDSTIFFHRVAEEGSWSIFRVDLSGTFEPSNEQRITPYGLPCFTPSASEDGKYIAFAVFTISDFNYKRHIEILYLGTESFHKVTALLHPNYDHYNPFFSPKSGFLGYHRFRGKSDSVDTMIHRVEFVTLPVKELRISFVF
ncbi:hypothetical protein IFM89_012671 [Coptis chinensis]|uniref:Uncharacterized protein n=1 Tax=Coptis chinensis TaxID=261450 RepID=A0A835LH11_9MAGN|nr:hypothetical protein IFM89_012671 [Coptis chinensis]